MAAATPENTMADSSNGVNWSRNAGVASSARASGGSSPRTTSAFTANPTPMNRSCEITIAALMIMGYHLSFRGSRSM